MKSDLYTEKSDTRKHWRHTMILVAHILLCAWAVGMAIACCIADRRNKQNKIRYYRLETDTESP